MPTHIIWSKQMQLEKDCCVIIKLWSRATDSQYMLIAGNPPYLKEFVDPFFYNSFGSWETYYVSHMWVCEALYIY